jgi:5-methylcytosine-specific restriction protein A
LCGHKAEHQRGTTKARGYAAGWPKIRALKLQDNPLCEIKLPGCLTLATEVDHIKTIDERPDLRLEWPNLQSACKPCNVRKAREKGEKAHDFGRKARGSECAA